MATRLQMNHLMECDVDTFWKTFLDEEFNRQNLRDRTCISRPIG